MPNYDQCESSVAIEMDGKLFARGENTLCWMQTCVIASTSA